MPAYHPYSEAEAVELARTVEGVFAPGAELECTEIGDGNLNLVFHITEPATGKGLIVKQALPYVKVFGESWPLSVDRARIEGEALKIQHSLAPELVPQVYFTDQEQAITVMEDLSSHVIMRKGLMEGTLYPRFASDISTFLAQTLFFTSDLGMSQQEKKLRQQSFVNVELCQITEDLIFDEPYREHERNNYEDSIADEALALRTDAALHLEIAVLREKFLTRGEALLHGDLHTGSIFALPDSTKVIDPEFAFYGPMGFDIGAVIANLLLNFAGQEHWSPEADSRKQYREFLTETVRGVWTQFAAKFRTLWDEHGKDPVFSVAEGFQDLYMNRLLQDTAGFAGAKMVRRVVGFAHVADLDAIPEDAVRERAKRMALAIGKELIKRHRTIASIEEVIDIALTASAR